jgi:hypothetical protein
MTAATADKTAAETDACRCCADGPGLERGDGGHTVGRDPRTMTPAQLREIGHDPMAPLKVIRARCLDCCAGSASEAWGRNTAYPTVAAETSSPQTGGRILERSLC